MGSRCAASSPLYGPVTVHCGDSPYFISLFISWWKLGLSFPTLWQWWVTLLRVLTGVFVRTCTFTSLGETPGVELSEGDLGQVVRKLPDRSPQRLPHLPSPPQCVEGLALLTSSPTLAIVPEHL